MSEDNQTEFSGEIRGVDYEFVRPILGQNFPKQIIQYICGVCKCGSYDAWYKVSGKMFRKIYCNSCKVKEEENAVDHGN